MDTGVKHFSQPSENFGRPVRYELIHVDRGTSARLGRLHTPHGVIDTPEFMPVGTRGSVKGLTPRHLWEAGSRMLLANTYHLALRPGEDIVQELGGLHRLMAWDGPILTDSGGFQVFSLSDRVRLEEAGVTFRSHIDGRQFVLTPERAVSIQEALGADVAMCLDHCPALPAEKREIAEAVARTVRWAARAQQAQRRADQALFGIVQGGSHEDLRAECAERLIEIGFDGYAVGGVSVGENREEVRAALEVSTHRLPVDQVRYLMGVGRPQDILDAVATGIDIFDCVLPTRNGRNATCLTGFGLVKMRNAIHKSDPNPIEPGCDCYACANFSRGAIRHYFLADEMLGPILASIHNLTYMHRLTRQMRAAIAEDAYGRFREQTLTVLGT